MERVLTILFNPEVQAAIIGVILTALIAAFLKWRSTRKGNKIEVLREYQSNELSLSGKDHQRVKVTFIDEQIERFYVNRLMITNIGDEDIKDLEIVLEIRFAYQKDVAVDDLFIESEGKDRVNLVNVTQANPGGIDTPNRIVRVSRTHLNRLKAHPDEVIMVLLYSNAELIFSVKGGGLGWSTVYKDRAKIVPTLRDRSSKMRNPAHADHRFRSMSITDSDVCRSPIPDHVDRGFRCMPIICIVDES
jgi:hypothetical protein